jgi:signal transduction histidine kinase
MVMIATFYFLTLFVSVVTGISITIYAWTHRRQLVGTLFFITTASGTFLLVCNLLILVSPTAQTAYFFARLQHLGASIGGVSILLFIMVYTGRIYQLNPAYIIPLYASASFNSVIILTDPMHDWFYWSFHVIQIDNFSFVQATFNWWFFVHSTYMLVIIVWCSILLLLAIRGTTGMIRRQYVGLFIALQFPPMTAILSVILTNMGLDWIDIYNPYPISFIIFNLIVLRILLRDHFLDIMPVAYPLILAEIPEGIIITDTYDRIIEINPLAKMHKPSATESYIGKLVHDTFPELQFLKTGDVITVNQANRLVYFEYQSKELYRGHEHIGRLIVLRDVTRQRQFQQHELELALQQERVIILTKFIEKVSHEVRTPLAIIRNSAYLINRVDDSQKRTDNVEQIKTQVLRINRLVDMMLKITHLESAKPTFAPINVDVFLSAISNGWQSKPDVVYTPTGNLPVIHGDQTLLYEAIGELLDNASRFSPSDSTITLSATVKGQYLHITVADEGMGIDVKTLPFVFEMFWRNEVTTHSGLGLGLPFVRQIAHLHGGDADVTSQVGVGSQFTIRLPI